MIPSVTTAMTVVVDSSNMTAPDQEAQDDHKNSSVDDSALSRNKSSDDGSPDTMTADDAATAALPIVMDSLNVLDPEGKDESENLLTTPNH